MIASSNLTTPYSTFIKITPSRIQANLIQPATSLINRGHQQDFTLNPGMFSIDPDANTFNASNWNYTYFCRIYGLYNSSFFNGTQLPIDDPKIGVLYPSCFSNRSDNSTAWRYASTVAPKSSITIRAGSLESNQTYQFMVSLINRQDPSIQAIGYLLVNVQDKDCPMITIGCVISSLCTSSNTEYRFLNPTTQLALFSICVGACSSLVNITWNVYHGLLNLSSNTVQWTRYNSTIPIANAWFYGMNTKNFTTTKDLFLQNSQTDYWRFEVIYSFVSETSSSTIDFLTNRPPRNGSCTIDPLNGTTSTLFHIHCPNWFDDDGIADYSFYGWTTGYSQKVMLGFTTVDRFLLRLPVGDNTTFSFNMSAHIRDTVGCVTEYSMSAVVVTPDSTGIATFVNIVQQPDSNLNANPMVALLASENQNTICQIITLLSPLFNEMSSESMASAVLGGVPATSILVSPLGAARQQLTSALLNNSALAEYKQQLNRHANVRDYLMTYATNLPSFTANSIELQASGLAQLTATTNQLTRTAAMLASTKCHQLALALQAMALEITYERAQSTTGLITQCATNVLTAINGPLQQRAIVLDLDLARADALPVDYDTNLDYEWANPNLFANGDDFSWQTIQSGRNTYYQMQTANTIAGQVVETVSLITAVLNVQLNIGQKMTVNTSATFASLETVSASSLLNKLIQPVGSAHIYIPPIFDSGLSNDTPVFLRSTMEPLAAAGASSSHANTNLSTSISLTVLDKAGSTVPISASTDHPIEFIIPRDVNLLVPPMTLQNVTSINNIHNQIFNLHYVNITPANTNLTVSLHFEMRPLDASVGYLLIFRFDTSPQLNSAVNQTDGWSLLCPSNLTNDSIHTYFIDNQLSASHRSVIFGLRELNSSEVAYFCTNNTTNNGPPLSNQSFNFSSNYELRTFTSGCYYLDSNNHWQSNGLLVGPLTNHYQTRCFSTHLTTFAGGFSILPAPINWNYVFANADFIKNKTIYLTVIIVCVIYIILIIYARRYDRKDLQKLGVTPMLDNNPADRYLYQIIVFTGHRKDAGTHSKVSFVMYGDKDQTYVRTFADPHRHILQRGSVDTFLLSVPKSLGSLNCLHIWHDNTGEGSSASWFLKYLIICDLQTMEKFHFIGQRWFAVEKDDGNIERLLPVASAVEKHHFSYVLTKRTYYSMSDGHLWFSIFSRPPSNRFTRVQRCTCCFVLLFISMFLNIMYYDLSNQTSSTTSINLPFGTVHIAPQQMIIGVIVEVLALIPSLLVVQLFRRLRPRRQQQSSTPADRKRKVVKMLPWWCIFVAYGLCIVLVTVSILFIIARGIEFGDDKTRQWLTSVVSGFFSSVLLTQPLKIITLAIFFAYFCAKTNDDEEVNEFLDNLPVNLNHDEEYLHTESLFTCRPETKAHRLSTVTVKHARRQRLQEIQMWTILREICVCLCFLSLLYLVTYSNRHPHAFEQVDQLRKYFLNSRQSELDYTKIATIHQYWNWLENNFVNKLRAQSWYNGDPPRNLSGFIDDKSSRLIGWATMRQLRVKTSPCHQQNILSSLCSYDYSLRNEEKQSYSPGWTNDTSLTYHSVIRRAFQYQSRDYSRYTGGGYVYEFRGRLSDLQSNISQLHQLSWIDKQTRAVIIQLTLYNPNVQLFTSVLFLAEFLSSTSIALTARFEPITFQGNDMSVSQLICTLAYLLIIVYFMCIEVRLLLQLKGKYFYRFWSLIDMGIIVCSWTSVGIYFWRYREGEQIGKRFAESNGYVYINLQFTSHVNNLLTIVNGFTCFFGTITLIKLCRFHARLYLFVNTLRRASKELLSFSVVFSLVFMSFICLFHLLFVSKLAECASFLGTVQMLFEMTLMKFDAHELSGAAAFLGPFCFSLFVFLVVFICMSMFLSIIGDNFRCAQENIDGGKREIFALMWNQFQRWTGWKKPTEEELQEQRDMEMRSQYYGSMELLVKRTDQLLVILNRLFISQISER